MARVAEQKGKNDLALYLLRELDDAAGSITLTQWIPALLFEIKSRRLRLLRMKATRSEVKSYGCNRRWINCWQV